MRLSVRHELRSFCDNIFPPYEARVRQTPRKHTNSRVKIGGLRTCCPYWCYVHCEIAMLCPRQVVGRMVVPTPYRNYPESVGL